MVFSSKSFCKNILPAILFFLQLVSITINVNGIAMLSRFYGLLGLIFLSFPFLTVAKDISGAGGAGGDGGRGW